MFRKNRLRTGLIYLRHAKAFYKEGVPNVYRTRAASETSLLLDGAKAHKDWKVSVPDSLNKTVQPSVQHSYYQKSDATNFAGSEELTSTKLCQLSTAAKS